MTDLWEDKGPCRGGIALAAAAETFSGGVSRDKKSDNCYSFDDLREMSITYSLARENARERARKKPS